MFCLWHALATTRRRERSPHPHDSQEMMLGTRVWGKQCLASGTRQGTGIIAMPVGLSNPFAFLSFDKVKTQHSPNSCPVIPKDAHRAPHFLKVLRESISRTG